MQVKQGSVVAEEGGIYWTDDGDWVLYRNGKYLSLSTRQELETRRVHIVARAEVTDLQTA